MSWSVNQTGQQTWTPRRKQAWSPRNVPLPNVPLPTRKGCIYLVKSKRYNFWKLGYTKNVKNRIKSLEQSCPFKLYLVYAIEGYQSEEKKLHKSLQNYQIKGEWYQFRGCECKIKDMMDQVDIEKEIIAVYNGLIWEARQNNREATENHKNRWRYPLRIKLNYAELKEQAVNKVLEVRDLLVAENKKYYKKCKLSLKK